MSSTPAEPYPYHAWLDHQKMNQENLIEVTPETFDALLEALETPTPAVSAMTQAHLRAAELDL
jgi:hypothetical protein